MSIFIETLEDAAINLDYVVRIERRGDKYGDKCRLEVASPNGTYKADTYYSLNELTRLTKPLVPAHPGFYLLGAYALDDPEEIWIDKSPVVAWRVDGEYAEAVTTDDQAHGDNLLLQGVLTPDGEVVAPFDATWGSVEGWKKEAKERLEKYRERQQAKAKAKAITEKEQNEKT